MSAQIIACDGCEFGFDAMDDRASIGSRDAESVAFCPLCFVRLRSSEEWAIWNSCNGIFELHPRRAQAEAVAKERYGRCDATVVPARAFVEPDSEHWHRKRREDELEHRRSAA